MPKRDASGSRGSPSRSPRSDDCCVVLLLVVGGAEGVGAPQKRSSVVVAAPVAVPNRSSSRCAFDPG